MFSRTPSVFRGWHTSDVRVRRWCVTTILAAACLMLMPSHANTQPLVAYNESAEHTFQQALKKFDAGEFLSAAKLFESIIAMSPANQKTTASFLMAARAHRNLRKYPDVIRVLRPVFIAYPASTYLHDCLLLYAEASARCNALIDAGTAYLACFMTDEDADRRGEAIEGLAVCMYDTRAADSLARVLPRFRDADATDSALARLARALTARDSLFAAGSVVALMRPRLRRMFAAVAEGAGTSSAAPAPGPRPPVSEAAGATAETPRIVLALPPAPPGSDRADIIDDVRLGIGMALADHRRETGQRIVLDDCAALSGMEPDTCAARTLADPSVVACLGGIFSDDARALAARCRESGLPCIMISATAAGLTTPHGTLFQMNIPFASRGAMLAGYARRHLGARRATVVASRASFTKSMAEAFIAEGRSLGIEITRTLYVDFDDPGLRARITDLFGDVAYDADGDMIFHAASTSREAEEMLHVLSTLHLPVKLLGAGDYNDPNMLRRFSDFADTITFESDYAPDTLGAAYGAFMAAYRNVRSSASPKNALFGYDAAGIVLAALRSGATGREAVLRAMEKSYIGLRSTIMFSSDCRNQALTVLRYHRGKLIRVTSATE